MYTNIEGEVIQCVERRVSIIRLYLVNHDEWDLDVYSRCILCSTFMKIAAAFMVVSAELSVESLCGA